MYKLQKKLAHDKKQRQVAQLVARCTAAMSDINTCLRDIEENYKQLKTCFDILFPDFFTAEVSVPVPGAHETSHSPRVDDDGDEYGDIQWEDEELPQLSFEETLAITGINSSYALVGLYVCFIVIAVETVCSSGQRHNINNRQLRAY